MTMDSDSRRQSRGSFMTRGSTTGAVAGTNPTASALSGEEFMVLGEPGRGRSTAGLDHGDSNDSVGAHRRNGDGGGPCERRDGIERLLHI